MVKSTMQNLRVRLQKSGKTYYYFDAGGKPRKEIPLGSDYVLAVRKWTELSAQHASTAPAVNFIEVIDIYEKVELPKLAKSTQATHRSDMKHLREFFGKPSPAPLEEIKPSHIRTLLKWKAAQPTTANRLKRLFSTIFNFARGEGYTDKENPTKGITGFELGRREVDITEQVYQAVWAEGDEPLRDAMDLAEVIGQRPGDVLRLTEHDIKDGLLNIKQGKTRAKVRIRIEGKLETVLARIKARKERYRLWSSSLAVNKRGMPLSKQVLRGMFETAREAAAVKAEAGKNKALAAEIRAMWFYDLRAKAADDTAEVLGEQAAADLLGHDSVQTTKNHYLRRGLIVGPSK
ncbi:Phage-related integrase [Polaromonas sp. CG9_12]|nr:Phage-related integrase [Polaromonas sp. CG9_12]